MSPTTDLPAGLETTALDTPGLTTDVGAALAAAGSDFGSLIVGVGNAVATTQALLTKTSADTTSALANTSVNVIAVQETIYDDNGTPTDSKTFVQNLPLIDFIDPVFYQWTNVRLQGQFFINEIATADTAEFKTHSSSDTSGQAGLLLFFGGGRTTDGHNRTQTDVGTQSDQAVAVGRARMYAQLNPRSDVGVPKPTKVIRGPSLQIVDGEIKDLPGGGVTPLTGRTMSLLIELRKPDGTPISGKAVSIDTDGTPWSFDGPSTTDAAGNLKVLLQRTIMPVPPGAPPGTTQDTSAKPVVVTARLGIVSNSTTVTF